MYKRRFTMAGICLLTLIGMIFIASDYDVKTGHVTDMVEEGQEDGGKEGDERSADLCREILKYDFSVQEYPIDTTRFTGDVEKEFLQAFYNVLTNRVPLRYWDSGDPCFFRDILFGSGKNSFSDSGFAESFVKKASYRLIDMDGDGLPELAIGIGEWSCILKYDTGQQRVTEYFELMLLIEGWKLIGSNRLGVHDTRYPHLERYKFLVLDEQGETAQSFSFNINSTNGMQFMISAEGEINGEAVVTKEEWEELTEAFFNVMETTVECMTYAEIFGEEADWSEEPEDGKEIKRVYQEFIAGERSAENIAMDMIPGMEDLKGEITGVEYLIYDVTGDQEPELLIRTKAEYYILTYRDGRLFLLLTLPTDNYVLLESGEVLYRSIWEDYDEYYEFDQIQPSGNILIENCFRRRDLNRDGIYDEADEYQCDGPRLSMQIITMKEWLERISEYLYVDEDGIMQVVGSIEDIEWITYIEYP